MRFVLFTDKTIAQCNSAINERIQLPASASRPALDGWTEKNGRFSIGLTAPVVGKFTRTTRLEGQIVRENGQTKIKGEVSDGAGPRGQMLVLGGLALVALFLLVQGQFVLAFGTLLAAGIILIPLKGDFENSDRLLMEVERVLKASPKPPKAAATKTVVKKPAGAAKPAAKASTAAKKTTGTNPAARSTSTRPAVSTAAKKPAVASSSPAFRK